MNDYQNKLHNQAAYAVRLGSGFFAARRSTQGTLSSGNLVLFSTRIDAEDYILNMIEVFGGEWTKARVFPIG